MITRFVAQIVRDADNSNIWNEARMEEMNALIQSRYTAGRDDADFYAELIETGPADMAVVLDIESDYAESARICREACRIVEDGPNGLPDVVSVLLERAASFDGRAAREIDSAASWFWDCFPYIEVDVPCDIEEGNAYEKAVSAGLDGWEAAWAKAAEIRRAKNLCARCGDARMPQSAYCPAHHVYPHF